MNHDKILWFCENAAETSQNISNPLYTITIKGCLLAKGGKKDMLMPKVYFGLDNITLFHSITEDNINLDLPK